MLTKLFKFDFKSNAKIQTILILVVLMMIPVFIITNHIGNNILTPAITVAAFLSCLGVFIGYAALQTIYFANTMSGRESYFTHTLPAGTHQILLSKLLSALAWGAGVILSIFLCWYCYLKIFDVSVLNEVFDIIKPVASMVVSQFLYLMTLIAFSVSLSVHHKFTGQPRLIVGIVTYLVISNASGVFMLFCIGIQLFFKGELSSFLANEWSDEKAIEFVYQIFRFISISYIVLAGGLYALTARVFSSRKSI